jgi:ABC-type multidrug transport system fused ATPase/permease subunit
VDHFYEALMGFSEHTGGLIKYDSKLLEDLDIGEIRNHIQIIAHDQFFAGTVFENLTGLGNRTNYTATEIQDVLMRVGLFENIEALPKKLETEIKPNGYPFTKSQLLAIQVARSILIKPKIVFVTTDFEQISSYKRKLIYKEIISRQNKWTLLFFTQRFYKGDFDRFTVFERSVMKNLADEAELLKEIETHG